MPFWLPWLMHVILIQIQPANPTQTKSKPPKIPNRKRKQKKQDIFLSLSLVPSPHASTFVNFISFFFPMETILSPHSLSPLFNPKPSSPKTLLSSSLQPRSNSLSLTKPITSSLRKHQPQSLKPSLPIPTSWFSYAQQGLTALALTLALNFSPLLPSGNALASEFDVLNQGPPKESYVVDDAGVLSRVTRSDLKSLLSDLESRKNFHINFVTVRKLTVSL
jgi:hypothetical protein